MSSREITKTESHVNDNDLADQLSDLWSIVRRHLGIVFASLIVAVGLGVLYYVKAPRTYSSTARLLISNQQYAGISASGEEDQTNLERSIETHALTVASRLIVEQAYSQFHLDKLETLRDEENPIRFIMDNLEVSVEEENATVLMLSYLSSDAEDCQTIVNAVASTYQDYMKEQNQTVDSETVEVIQSAYDRLTEQLNESKLAYSEFESTADLAWKESKAVNIHRERQLSIEQARQELLVKRTVLKAKIDSLTAALDQGDVSREAVYFQAMKEFEVEKGNSKLYELQMQREEDRVVKDAVSQYASLLTSEYVTLMVKEREMLDEFGPGHPSLDSVVRRKDMVKRLLQKTLQNEQPLGETIVNPEDATASKEKDRDYVAIYMQMLRDDLAIIDKQIESLDLDYVTAQGDANKIQNYLSKDRAMQNEIERLEEMQKIAKSQLVDIDLIRRYGGENAQVLGPAELGEQVAPELLKVAVASLFLGCMFGCAIAYTVDRAENTFRTPQEIRHALRLPIVGRIPLVRRNQQITLPTYPSISPVVCTVHQEGSQVSEAFRGVRTNLFFSTAGQNYKVIQITSPSPGDGKSTLTANLAVAIAKSGKSVLVIDADFRRPSMHRLFGKSRNNQYGLAAVVSGVVGPIEAAVKTEIDNLYFMAAGDRPHNPSELLSTPEFKEMLEVVREHFDFVLIDTPPLLAVTDPCAVAARVDGVLMTLRIRKGVVNAAIRAKELLNSIEANVLGVVVNGLDDRRGNVQSDYYGHEYEMYSDEGATGAARVDLAARGRVKTAK